MTGLRSILVRIEENATVECVIQGKRIRKWRIFLSFSYLNKAVKSFSSFARCLTSRCLVVEVRTLIGSGVFGLVKGPPPAKGPPWRHEGTERRVMAVWNLTLPPGFSWHGPCQGCSNWPRRMAPVLEVADGGFAGARSSCLRAPRRRSLDRARSPADLDRSRAWACGRGWEDVNVAGTSHVIPARATR